MDTRNGQSQGTSNPMIRVRRQFSYRWNMWKKKIKWLYLVYFDIICIYSIKCIPCISKNECWWNLLCYSYFILNRDFWILHIIWHHLSLSLIRENIPDEFENGKQKTHKFYLCLSILFFTFQNGSVSWKLLLRKYLILLFCLLAFYLFWTLQS